MNSSREIVITGMGVVSPIGIGDEAFWASLRAGRGGIRRLELFDGGEPRPAIGADVRDFDPKRFVRPRKSLKVMSRDIQLAFAAADMAVQQAAINGEVDPERFGVVFGADMIACDLSEIQPAFAKCIVDGRFDFARWGEAAMSEMFPLWMLKYLPNMPACHVGIAQDARGPNNSLTMGDASSLAAVAEACRVLERGQADAMIAGGVGCRLEPAIWAYHRAYQLSARVDDPAAALRPFDADRDGLVFGEGSGVVVLEERRHAEARGAAILARIKGFACCFEPRRAGDKPEGVAVGRSIVGVLEQAGLRAADIGHVNAHGLGTTVDDRLEAKAIRDTLGDVPVTALKGFFGSLGAGSGAIEIIANVLALRDGVVPPTLNYHKPDPECPIRVIRDEPMPIRRPTALVLSQSRIVQSMALLLTSP
ncbi:MAG: beta-ketoacyl-[acyl-carrier-protein] synthase family protein [Pirellulaceae bacterium]|nr:beta-ketoacyl-[acyl-carrier-protein] synthase family protein [Pirellulaceae bacterium]